MPSFPDGNLLFQDTFTRADTGPPPSSDYINVNGGLKVVSNQLAPHTGNLDETVYIVPMNSQDLDVTLDLAVHPILNGTTYIISRFSTGAICGYGVFMFSGGGGNDFLQIRRYDSGVGTDLGTGVSVPPLGNGNAIGLRVDGTSIQTYVRYSGVWTWFETVTDATWTGAAPQNTVMIGSYSGDGASTVARWDNFSIYTPKGPRAITVARQPLVWGNR